MGVAEIVESHRGDAGAAGDPFEGLGECVGMDLSAFGVGEHPAWVVVVSERLDMANIAFTIETYQHVLPGMQADAAAPSKHASPPAYRTPAAPATCAGRTPPEPGRRTPTTKAQVSDLGLRTGLS